MKTLFSMILIAPLVPAIGFSQPMVAAITNSASYSIAPLPNSGIAQGSFFTIFGSGLGPAVSACGSGLTDCIWKPYPLPIQIQGASVSVTTGNNAPVNAYIYLAFDSQINAVMPSTVAPGTGQLTVTYNNQTSQPVNITVVPSSVGTFTQNESGGGPGIFFNIASNGAGTINSFMNTAKPGQYITMYGTGLGAPVDVSTEGSQLPQFPDDFTKAPHNLGVDVWVGGRPAAVAYAGRAQFTALDQINFIIPTGVQGCHLSVAIQVTPPGGTPVVSNFTSLAVDPNGAPCQDSDGVNMYSLVPTLQKNGSVNVGTIGLHSVNLVDLLGTTDQWTLDTVTAKFGNYTPGMLNAFQGFAEVPAVNDCSVKPYFFFAPPGDPALALLKNLDAGPSLTIQGPLGMASVPQNTDGQGYSGMVGGALWSNILNYDTVMQTPSFFLNQMLNSDGSNTYLTSSIASGNYTVTGPGGADVGALTAPIAVSMAAASFQWTNQSVVLNSNGATPLLRNQPLTVTWTGGDPQGYVRILILGFTATTRVPPDGSAPSIVAQCTAQAGNGAFTIPAYVLESVPPSALGVSDFAGFLSVGPASGVQKVTTPPSGLDALYIFYDFVQTAEAYFQ